MYKSPYYAGGLETRNQYGLSMERGKCGTQDDSIPYNNNMELVNTT